MKKWLAWAAAAMVVLVGGYFAYDMWLAAPQPAVAVARLGSIRAQVETIGRIQAQRQINLAPQVSGMVQTLPVQVGDQLQAGQLLMQLYDPALERAVRQAELTLELRDLQLEQAKYGGDDAQIAIATARLRQATVNRQIAQEAYDELASDEDAGTSAEALALETAKVSYEIAQAEFERAVSGATSDEVRSLTIQRDLAQLGLEAARDGLRQAALTAPFEGTILSLAVREGENAYARNPVAVLADLTALEVLAEVDEIDIAQVSVGQRVDLVLDAFPDQTLEGMVTAISPSAMPQRGSTIYEAVIQFNGQGLAIRPDMSTNLTITTLEREMALLVPNRAIQRVGQATIVRVLEGRRQRPREVVVGLSNGQETEVLSGLEEGELVLLE